MNQNPGGRFGIWGENPSTERMDPIVSPFEHAMSSAKSVQDLFGNYYKNKMSGLDSKLKEGKLQEQQQTLPQKIAAMNAKYGADEKYYPLQQSANLQHTEAQVKEVMARTGLTYTQAKVAMAHLPLLAAQTQKAQMGASPGASFDSIYNEYQNSQPGAKKDYLENMLNGMMSGGILQKGGVKGGNSSGASGGQGISSGAQVGGLTTNPLDTTRGGAKQAYDDGQTFEAPTQASKTRNQVRKEAHAENMSAYNFVTQGLEPYQGRLGSMKLAYDSAKYGSDPEAKARIDNYQTARKLMPELVSINARQATGQAPGIELQKEYQGSMFPNMPLSIANYAVPNQAIVEANKKYLPIQNNMVESAINQERQGYGQEGDQPPWAQKQQNLGGFFSGGQYVPRGDPQQNDSQDSGQQNVDYNSMAQEAIAKGADPKMVQQRLSQLQKKGK